MTMIWRKWTAFDYNTLMGNDPNDTSFTLKTDWTTEVADAMRCQFTWNPYFRQKALIRPSASSFILQDSLDTPIDWHYIGVSNLISNSGTFTGATLINYCASEPNKWIQGLVN